MTMELTAMGEICILAGGLSTRMGRDKARLRLGRRTLLGHVRAIAGQTDWPVRVVRHDLVARCGPLGGVLTALKTTTHDRVLFLACDMPKITTKLLEQVMEAGERHTAVFSTGAEGAGFPFLLHKNQLAAVEEQIAEQHYSLQALARRCCALPVRAAAELLVNVNTPDEYKALSQKG